MGSNRASDRQSPQARIGGLELLRLLCCLAVLVFHYRHFFVVNNNLPAEFSPESQPFYGVLTFFYEHGAAAVQVFWAISGYVFFWNYEGPIAGGKLRFGRFLMLRLSRLYPLHLATLLTVALLQSIYAGFFGYYFVYTGNDPAHFLAHTLFVSNWIDTAYTFNGPVWSVSVEILVYLIFFALLAHGVTSRPWQRGLALAVAASVSMIGERAEAAGVPQWLCFANLWQCLAYFYLGGLILDCERAVAIRLGPSRLRQRGWAVRGFSLLATGTLVGLAGAAIAGYGINLVSVLVIVAGANFAYALAGSPLLARLAKLGVLTYSIYLVHFPVQLLTAIGLALLGVGTAAMYSPLAFLASTAATILLAWCSYHAFEAPAQRRIRAAWERWEAGKAVRTAAAARTAA